MEVYFEDLEDKLDHVIKNIRILEEYADNIEDAFPNKLKNKQFISCLESLLEKFAPNINGFKELSKHAESEFVVFDGLNHLFQKCLSCKITEYGALESTIEMEVLEKVEDWINKR